MSIFLAGRFEDFATAKCDFLAKLVPAARKNKVKFWKYVLMGSCFCCKLTSVELLCGILYSRNTSECCRFKLKHRSVAAIGRLLSPFFSAIRLLHYPFLCVLERWFRIRHRKFRIRKKWPQGPFKIFKITMGDPKSKFDNFNKKGHVGCKSRENFKSGIKIKIEQHLTPFLAKNGRKLAKFSFRPFHGQKRLNAVRFKFWDQIWNPIVICSQYDYDQIWNSIVLCSLYDSFC